MVIAVTVNNNIIIITYLTLLLITGLAFKSQPQGNVTIAEGDDAYFLCMYDGIHTSPHWNISSVDGQQKIVSTNNLPYKHYFNGTGLVVQNVDARNNMTLYSCILQVVEGDGVTVRTSTSGQLIVKENIHFSLQLINGNLDIDI